MYMYHGETGEQQWIKKNIYMRAGANGKIRGDG